ncbi:MAG TPA: hypothetical protein VHR66_29065 [Gemmataceae bacterium]|nr:hypothetical protein [Gemmataceae bacterium]
MGLTIAKVGGSLFDLPDLAKRLRRWMATVKGRLLLVPGGGEGADVIRRLDGMHKLGDNAAHWLALRLLTVNSEFIANLVETDFVAHPREMESRCGVLDAHEFCTADLLREQPLEHSWRVTSDAVAARVAEVCKGHLTLLKSTDLPDGMSWEAAADAGLVDDVFPEIVRRARLKVTWVNFRNWK